jgi:hypothetical protein
VLWAERFKSVLLEGGEAVAAVAAYVDLNPVRAGLCVDPKDYRYCGYAEALGSGCSLAREGIRTNARPTKRLRSSNLEVESSSSAVPQLGSNLKNQDLPGKILIL